MRNPQPIQVYLFKRLHQPTYPCYWPVAPVSEAASSAEAAVEAGGDKIRLLVAYGLALRRGDTRIGPAKASMAAAPTCFGLGFTTLTGRSGARAVTLSCSNRRGSPASRSTAIASAIRCSRAWSGLGLGLGLG